MKTLIIAEAGVNHNGDLDTALKLCRAAKEAGADVIKFQTWITDNTITKNVAKAEYQKENTKNDDSQYEMLKKLELSQNDFRIIERYCDGIGIIFASTADDKESLDFLVKELDIPFIKVGSGDIGNVSYLRYIGSKNKTVILSTGMSTLEDIRISIDALRQGGCKTIKLLHCTTNYPCPMEDVNLNAIDTLKKEFDLPVGYSDHTKGIEVAIAAVAKGARIIEKHFTLDKNMDGPDHLASTEPQEFKQMVDAIRNIEKALGTGVKVPSNSEIDISKVVFKRIVAAKDIKKGETITEEMIACKRNGNGEPARNYDLVVGSVANKDYSIDEGIIL